MLHDPHSCQILSRLDFDSLPPVLLESSTGEAPLRNPPVTHFHPSYKQTSLPYTPEKPLLSPRWNQTLPNVNVTKDKHDPIFWYVFLNELFFQIFGMYVRNNFNCILYCIVRAFSTTKDSETRNEYLCIGENVHSTNHTTTGDKS